MYTRGKKFIPKSKEGTVEGNRYYFNGWSVDKQEHAYVLQYIQGQQGGGTATVEISAEDYQLARERKVDWDYMLKKYLHKLQE